MSCHHESHNHGHDGHDHNGHDHDDPERGIQYSLYKHIDSPNIQFLNCINSPSSNDIFKPYDQRFDLSKYITSDPDDAQIIIKIPFTGCVKLKAIALLGDGLNSPLQMKAFVNNPILDFTTIESHTPTQSWDCLSPHDQSTTFIPEYETRISKFNAVQFLILFFPNNFTRDDETSTKIFYIGLKGEFKELNKNPIITVYELNANPADHKVEGDDLKNLGMNFGQ